MTFDTVALVCGSAAIGFAPVICFFFQITFPKSQLIIVAITAAFFYLLSSLVGSMVWYLLDPVLNLSSAWSAILPSIFFQFVFRAGFVALYHKVEAAIEESLERTEFEQENAGRGEENSATATDLEAAKLRLELNDVASGIAAGTGYGGMHAIILFGSLLAFETADMGVLYQPSCPYLPSLLVSALNCFFFFFLDIFWMLFTFFGMRRRLIFPRGGGALQDLNPVRRRFGGYFGNTRTGGNAALLFVLVTHVAAAGLTTFNHFQYGCTISLSAIPGVLVIVAYFFWSGVGRIYVPLPHSSSRLSLPASFSYGERADMENNGEDVDAVLQARHDD